jgi:hypothetical protein
VRPEDAWNVEAGAQALSLLEMYLELAGLFGTKGAIPRAYRACVFGPRGRRSELAQEILIYSTSTANGLFKLEKCCQVGLAKEAQDRRNFPARDNWLLMIPSANAS